MFLSPWSAVLCLCAVVVGLSSWLCEGGNTFDGESGFMIQSTDSYIILTKNTAFDIGR